MTRFIERRAVSARLNKTKDKIRFCPAYSGGLLFTDDNPYPSIIDIASCTLESEIPILFRHDEDACVGYVTELWKEGNRIYAAGKIGSTPEAFCLIDNDTLLKIQTLDETIRLKPSIGADYRFQDPETQKVFVPYGDTVTVNGREFHGPCYVLYDTYLTEISLVIHAGDPEARAILAELRGSHEMSWEDFLSEKGLDPDSYAALSVEEQDALKQEFDATALDSTGVTAEGDMPPDATEAPPPDILAAGEALAAAVTEVVPDPAAAEELAAVITEVALEEIAPAVEAEGETEEEKKDQAVAAEGCGETKEEDKKAVSARLQRRIANALVKHATAGQGTLYVARYIPAATSSDTATVQVIFESLANIAETSSWEGEAAKPLIGKTKFQLVGEPTWTQITSI